MNYLDTFASGQIVRFLPAWSERAGCSPDKKHLLPQGIEYQNLSESLLGSLHGFAAFPEDIPTDIFALTAFMQKLSPGGVGIFFLGSHGWKKKDLEQIVMGSGFQTLHLEKLPFRASFSGPKKMLVVRKTPVTKENSGERKKLSVIIAITENKAGAFESLKAWSSFLPGLYGPAAEILLVNDGRLDSEESLRLFQKDRMGEIILFNHYRSFGEGRAVRTALMHAAGKRILVDDSQGRTNPQSCLPMLLASMRESPGCVLGVRTTKEAAQIYNLKERRKNNLPLFAKFARKIMGTACPYSDFRLYSRDAARATFLYTESDGEDYRIEALETLSRDHMPIVDVPVDGLHDIGNRGFFRLAKRKASFWFFMFLILTLSVTFAAAVLRLVELI